MFRRRGDPEPHRFRGSGHRRHQHPHVHLPPTRIRGDGRGRLLQVGRGVDRALLGPGRLAGLQDRHAAQQRGLLLLPLHHHRAARSGADFVRRGVAVPPVLGGAAVRGAAHQPAHHQPVLPVDRRAHGDDAGSPPVHQALPRRSLHQSGGLLPAVPGHSASILWLVLPAEQQSGPARDLAVRVADGGGVLLDDLRARQAVHCALPAGLLRAVRALPPVLLLVPLGLPHAGPRRALRPHGGAHGSLHPGVRDPRVLHRPREHRHAQVGLNELETFFGYMSIIYKSGSCSMLCLGQ